MEASPVPTPNTPPRIALTLGDPAGIGPEIVRAVLGTPRLAARMRLLLLGPGELRPDHVPLVPERSDGDPGARRSDAPPVEWLATATRGGWTPGRAQASAGHAALAALREGSRLALSGAVDALVTAPVSKEALHLAGERVEGQTELLGRLAGARAEMLAVAGELRVLLLTRHLPLAAALRAITTDGVHAHLRLLHDGLVRMGFAAPRLALAGLNPHAGEGGILGTEEEELLRPAVERARAEGIRVTGPVSPDVVFLQGLEGLHDGVLALYHDQAFIPVKLAAPRSGLTVLLGLPYLRVSPAHGTAFDRVGTGTADPGNLLLALERAAEWSAAARSAPAARS